MNELIVPANIAAQLQGLPHPIPLCDAAGKQLGYFLPTSPPEGDDLEPGISDEELTKIEQSTEWYSTQEVLDHLEKLR